MAKKDVALGILVSKVDRGEMDIAEAVEEAFKLGYKAYDEEPTTVRYVKKQRVLTPLTLEGFK